MDPAVSGGDKLSCIVNKSRAKFTGLRLPDGTLIVKVSRGRRTEQIRVMDGEAFDPARSGLRIRMEFDVFPPSGMERVENLYAMTTPR